MKVGDVSVTEATPDTHVPRKWLFVATWSATMAAHVAGAAVCVYQGGAERSAGVKISAAMIGPV